MEKAPNVAWIFYPWNKTDLLAMLDGFFKKTKVDIHGLNLKAIVAPHAWYIYAGPVASYSYKALQSYIQTLIDNTIALPTFVIMAPSHYEYFSGVSVWAYEAFQTPLWDIAVNLKLSKQIIKEYPDFFSYNPSAFMQEHSLEVQLPFLQYIIQQIKINGEKLQILPLIFGDTDHATLGNILYELSRKNNLFFIVSSDLSHYMSYRECSEKDKHTLRYFSYKSIDKIVHWADACGINPRLALTQLAIRSKREAKLLKHMNSWDTTWDKTKVVGYGSMVYY